MRRARLLPLWSLFLAGLGTVLVVGACSADSGVPVLVPGPPGQAVRSDVDAAPTTQARRSGGSTTSTTAPPAPTTTPPLPDGVTVTPSVKRPNILVVMTDDQTVDEMKALTQVQQRIAAQGTTFSNSVTSYPLCCPSRATYFSGQYAHNHRVLWNAEPTGGYRRFESWETALPASMQEAGYHTAHVGKLLNGYGVHNPTDVPAGWDDFRALIDPSTGQYFGFSINDNGRIDNYDPEDRSLYSTDVLTDVAIEEIDAAESSGKPWFVNVAYLAPHAAFGVDLQTYRNNPTVLRNDIEDAETAFDIKNPVPAPRHRGAFADEPLPKKANFDAAPIDQVVPQWRPSVERRTPDITKNYRLELESLLAVDEGVGRLLDHLESTGVADDTVVVFTSDNGYFHGEHREYQGKYYPWEEALAVPLIMKGPGVARGVEADSVVANVDLATTFLDLAGGAPLRTMDGRSLVSMMGNPAVTWDRAILTEGFQPPASFRPQYQGIRTNHYSYIEYTGGGLQGVELYDLRTDPDQIDNLALDADQANRVRAFNRLVTDLRQCAGDECTNLGLPRSVTG